MSAAIHTPDPQRQATVSRDDPAPRGLPPARHRVRAATAPVLPSVRLPEVPEPAPDQTTDAVKDYEVGYGRPPKHSQFKPGNNANPKGRPKGAKSFSTIVVEELSQQVAAKIGGRTVKIDVRRALVKQAIQKGLAGDFRALMALAKMDDAANPQPAVALRRSAEEALPPEVENLLDQFLQGLEQDGAGGTVGDS